MILSFLSGVSSFPSGLFPSCGIFLDNYPFTDDVLLMNLFGGFLFFLLFFFIILFFGFFSLFLFLFFVIGFFLGILNLFLFFLFLCLLPSEFFETFSVSFVNSSLSSRTSAIASFSPAVISLHLLSDQSAYLPTDLLLLLCFQCFLANHFVKIF
jgi:hypothetical protein